MLNEIFMWIYDAIGAVLRFCFVYVGLPALGIVVFGWIWPYISGVIKFFVFMIPVAVIFVLYQSGDLLAVIWPVLGIVAAVVALFLLFRFFDTKFGILMTREEAERKGLL